MPRFATNKARDRVRKTSPTRGISVANRSLKGSSPMVKSNTWASSSTASSMSFMSSTSPGDAFASVGSKLFLNPCFPFSRVQAVLK